VDRDQSRTMAPISRFELGRCSIKPTAVQMQMLSGYSPEELDLTS